MAIPFKSPISFGNTTLSEDSGEFKINAAAGCTLTLGPHTAIIDTGSASLGIGSNVNLISPYSLTLTGQSINITNNNDKNILSHSSEQNIYGDTSIKTILQGYPFYIAGDSVNEDVLASDENGITLSNNTKNTNIKGSNIVIDGSRLTVPADTRLNSIARTLEPTSIACINDLGFEITPHENTI